MSDNQGDTTKKHQQIKQLSSTPSPNDLEDSTADHQIQSRQQQQQAAGASPMFLSAPLYSSTAFDQRFEAINPKRQRYGGPQWKFLPTLPSQQPQVGNDSSTPSPTNLQHQYSSETASSPAQSPCDHKHESLDQPFRSGQQFRKGKYVSPVWKPNEMLCLARAWRVQYQGGGTDIVFPGGDSNVIRSGKTRAEKDREVAEFLNRHGINRDAKTAGTKWDNMLGEFRKVYDWERELEREQVGKSYFRLSPYERKVHRLPASFDEEVFDELSQFMGSRMRTQTRVVNLSGDHENKPNIVACSRPLPPPPPFKDEEHPLSGRRKQLMGTASSGGLFGCESSMDIVGVGASPKSKELHRIGKVRMIWEESVSLWAEEGENQRGMVRVQGLSFLNDQDELVFFDDYVVACAMEAFEDGPLRGFSVDRFVNGQQVRVFGRKKSPSSPTSSGSIERNNQLQFTDRFMRSMPQIDFQDPTDYYIGCLQQSSSPVLPSLFELSWRLQEPPPEEYKLPLRKELYKDLPPGKEIFFTTSNNLLDCRSFLYEILSPIIRNNNTISASSRDSFISLWDDCINRVISKFCPADIVFVRKPSDQSSNSEPMQDQWPNITGFVNNLCLWRGEETDQLRDGQHDPSSSIVEKFLWSFTDLPYLLGYYAVGYTVKFCALSRSIQQDRIIRTDLYSVDLSSPTERLKALVPCYRIASLLPLLAARCNASKKTVFSDFERIHLCNGNVTETTPFTVVKSFSNKLRWAAVKEIYDILDQRIPHCEYIHRVNESELRLVFKPRGLKLKPMNLEQLMEALKSVTKALVALHDLSFMHRNIGWDKVLRRSDADQNEWFVSGFDDAVGAPQINPHGWESASHAPEMARGLHGVKVDIFGVGYLLKTCGLTDVPQILRDLQSRCLEQNPEQRPTAADCYHHLLQVQSSLPPSAGGGAS